MLTNQYLGGKSSSFGINVLLFFFFISNGFLVTFLALKVLVEPTQHAALGVRHQHLSDNCSFTSPAIAFRIHLHNKGFFSLRHFARTLVWTRRLYWNEHTREVWCGCNPQAFWNDADLNAQAILPLAFLLKCCVATQKGSVRQTLCNLAQNGDEHLASISST